MVLPARRQAFSAVLNALKVRHFTATSSLAAPKQTEDGNYHPTDMELVQIVRSRRGPDILHNPWANKANIGLTRVSSFNISRKPHGHIISDYLNASQQAWCACQDCDICRMIMQGTAFPESERERLGIRGLLPTKVTDMKLQACQCLQHTAYGLFHQATMCHTSFSSL